MFINSQYTLHGSYIKLHLYYTAYEAETDYLYTVNGPEQ
jgi:hypothetical protein